MPELGESLPLYSVFEGEVCRVIERPEIGSIVSEVWRDGRWMRGASVAECSFRAPIISEETARSMGADVSAP